MSAIDGLNMAIRILMVEKERLLTATSIRNKDRVLVKHIFLILNISNVGKLI
jgi:hypothetical protein